MNAAANEAVLWDRPMPRRESPERKVPMTAERVFEMPEPEGAGLVTEAGKNST
jgi:hypothetical protein